ILSDDLSDEDTLSDGLSDEDILSDDLSDEDTLSDGLSDEDILFDDLSDEDEDDLPDSLEEDALPDEFDSWDEEASSKVLEEAKTELDHLERMEAHKEPEIEKPDLEQIEINVATGIHKGISLSVAKLPEQPEKYQKAKNEMQHIISPTINEIKKSLIPKRSASERNLRKGKLDLGALWKVGVKDPAIFQKKSLPGSDPDLAVYLLVDCSGSMARNNGGGGPSRMQVARSAALVLAEACIALQIPYWVTGFTAEFHGPIVTHLSAVDISSQSPSAIASLSARADNRDGFSIRVAGEELAIYPEKKKILIVLSDGCPGHRFSYVGGPAETDVAQATRELQKRGITVIGIHFGNAYEIPIGQMMYQNFIHLDRLENLPQLMGRMLKEVILK
ncbi:MAG: hypothetical protein GX992_06870, partial [Clostridium sp.]|nr:hypothetical protein [Clostridium sp.]